MNGRIAKKYLVFSILLTTMTLPLAPGSFASWIDQTLNSANDVSAGSIGSASGVTATAAATSNANSLCKANSITISWTVGTGATSYLVERQVNSGTWQTVNANTGNVTSISDPNGYAANEAVTYRVTGLLAGTSWTSAVPAASNTLQCGVVDLTATQPCTDVVLNWSAAAGATTYDIWRSTDGGANWASVTTNVSGTTYSVTTSHTAGTDTRYRIVPGYNNTTPNYAADSNATPQLTGPGGTGWQPFYVTSVSIANSGTLGTLNAGDTVTTSFSKSVDTTTVTLDNSIRTRTGTNRLYLAATSNTNNQIGAVTTGSIFATGAAYTGTPSWTSGDTVLTWTASGAGTTMSADLSTSTGWTRSTTVKCNDGATSLASTPLPAFSGRW